MKDLIKENIIWIVFMIVLLVAGLYDSPSEREEKKLTNEKLRLEIQHLKYQVGIDSLRYDLELNFYEKRK